MPARARRRKRLKVPLGRALRKGARMDPEGDRPDRDHKGVAILTMSPHIYVTEGCAGAAGAYVWC